VIIEKLSRQFPVPVYGDGSNIREWIHVQDNCRAIQLVLEKGNPGEIYNIGTENRLSNLDLIKLIATKMYVVGADLVEFVSDRAGHDFRYAIDSSKIITLGFKQERDFDFGIRETIKWYLENRNWWN
jgi:dTDP-glucose 4,6-dehydratase